MSVKQAFTCLIELTDDNPDVQDYLVTKPILPRLRAIIAPLYVHLNILPQAIEIVQKYLKYVCSILSQPNGHQLCPADTDPTIQEVANALFVRGLVPHDSPIIRNIVQMFCAMTNKRPSLDIMDLLGTNGPIFVRFLSEEMLSQDNCTARAAISTLTNLLIDNIDPELFLEGPFFEAVEGILDRRDFQVDLLTLFTAMAVCNDSIMVEDLLGTVAIASWIVAKIADDLFPRSPVLNLLRALLNIEKVSAVRNFFISNQPIFGFLLDGMAKTRDLPTQGYLADCIHKMFDMGAAFEEKESTWNPFGACIARDEHYRTLVEEFAGHPEKLISEKFEYVLDRIRENKIFYGKSKPEQLIWD